MQIPCGIYVDVIYRWLSRIWPRKTTELFATTENSIVPCFNMHWSAAKTTVAPCINLHGALQLQNVANISLRWFETVFHFPFQLNFMKGLLVCSKRLLLLVDSRCCNNLSTYQLLCSHWHFGCHGNLTGPQIHPISSIQLHFTQKVVGKLPFLLHQNCLHVKEHF